MSIIDGSTIEIRDEAGHRPVWASSDMTNGPIVCEINHPDYGMIPFTANKNDVATHGPLIWARAKDLVPDSYVAPPPTQDDYKVAIQALVDQTAFDKNYTDGVSCASYKDSTVTAWAAEAAAFIAWRDSVWSYAFAQMADVLSGTRTPQPSVEQLLSELPTITWPEG